jgi:hypothetical protein
MDSNVALEATEKTLDVPPDYLLTGNSDAAFIECLGLVFERTCVLSLKCCGFLQLCLPRFAGLHLTLREEIEFDFPFFSEEIVKIKPGKWEFEMSPVIIIIGKKCDIGVCRRSSLVIDPDFKLLL